jgi:hypothetical protein
MSVISKKFSIFTGFFSKIFGVKSYFFCSRNFTGRAPGRSGNFDFRYLICFRAKFRRAHACFRPGPRSKTDLLTLEHGIVTGPVNRATFQSAGPRAGLLKLETCTVFIGAQVIILCLCFDNASQ